MNHTKKRTHTHTHTVDMKHTASWTLQIYFLVIKSIRFLPNTFIYHIKSAIYFYIRTVCDIIIYI